MGLGVEFHRHSESRSVIARRDDLLAGREALQRLGEVSGRGCEQIGTLLCRCVCINYHTYSFRELPLAGICFSNGILAVWRNFRHPPLSLSATADGCYIGRGRRDFSRCFGFLARGIQPCGRRCPEPAGRPAISARSKPVEALELLSKAIQVSPKTAGLALAAPTRGHAVVSHPAPVSSGDVV